MKPEILDAFPIYIKVLFKEGQKKAVSVLLPLLLVMSLGATAFADGGKTCYEEGLFYIEKAYGIFGDEYSKSPAEDFHFTLEGYAVEHVAEGITKDNMPLPKKRVYDPF